MDELCPNGLQGGETRQFGGVQRVEHMAGFKARADSNSGFREQPGRRAPRPPSPWLVPRWRLTSMIKYVVTFGAHLGTLPACFLRSPVHKTGGCFKRKSARDRPIFSKVQLFNLGCAGGMLPNEDRTTNKKPGSARISHTRSKLKGMKSKFLAGFVYRFGCPCPPILEPKTRHSRLSAACASSRKKCRFSKSCVSMMHAFPR